MELKKPKVLFVSKPLAPPWNDSSKNLAWWIAKSLRRYSPVLVSHEGHPTEQPSVEWLKAYTRPREGGFQIGGWQKAKLFRSLIGYRKANLWNLFFAPNPSSNYALWALAKSKNALTVHTVCSAPLPVPKKRLVRTPLPRVDKIVVLSKHTEDAMLELGAHRHQLVRIAPCVEMPSVSASAIESARHTIGLPNNAENQSPVLIYAGDLEFGSGALLSLQALADCGHSDAKLIMASRAKTPHAQQQMKWLDGIAQKLGVSPRVRWVGETRHIHSLLAIADVVLLPSETLFAKMDYPMVALEALALAKPVIVSRTTPAAELEATGGVVVSDPVRASVSSQVQRLLHDASTRQQLGVQGQQYVSDHFTSEVVAGAYEKLYDELTLTRASQS